MSQKLPQYPNIYCILEANVVSITIRNVLLYQIITVLCFKITCYPSKGKSQEQLRKSSTEMTKLDKKRATDSLVSMRAVEIVGNNNNNVQEGKKLLSLPPGMLTCDLF